MVRTNVKESSVRRKDKIKMSPKEGLNLLDNKTRKLLISRSKEIGTTPEELMEYLIDELSD